jgi:hypothetical protein
LHEGLRDGCAGYLQQKKGRSGEGLKMGFKRSKVQRFNVSGSQEFWFQRFQSSQRSSPNYVLPRVAGERGGG